MSLLPDDYIHLQKMINENPRNRDVIQKLMSSHQFTISKISHEIRNPMALIYSTLQFIESQHPEARNFKYWTEMRGDIEFVVQLLQELSSLNNSEHFHKTSFSSYDFLSRCCLSFAASCADSNIIFSSKLSHDLPTITADKLKLQEVILNLLRNAKEAISEQGDISLHAFAQDTSLCIKISDTGCGIPEEYLDTIFDPFVTYKPAGTGLGLAIAKRVILAHNGNIFVESVTNKGTCFTIELPLDNM